MNMLILEFSLGEIIPVVIYNFTIVIIQDQPNKSDLYADHRHTNDLGRTSVS